jgi:hypothetical protein
MGSTPETTPQPPAEAATEQHHDFELQKRIHRQIRNDSDYDDWEYGTEPLPHEAWVHGSASGPSKPGAPGAPTGTTGPTGTTAPAEASAASEAGAASGQGGTAS